VFLYKIQVMPLGSISGHGRYSMTTKFHDRDQRLEWGSGYSEWKRWGDLEDAFGRQIVRGKESVI